MKISFRAFFCYSEITLTLWRKTLRESECSMKKLPSSLFVYRFHIPKRWLARVNTITHHRRAIVCSTQTCYCPHFNIFTINFLWNEHIIFVLLIFLLQLSSSSLFLFLLSAFDQQHCCSFILVHERASDFIESGLFSGNISFCGEKTCKNWVKNSEIFFSFHKPDKMQFAFGSFRHIINKWMNEWKEAMESPPNKFDKICAV